MVAKGVEMDVVKPVTIKEVMSRPLMKIKLIFMAAGFFSLALSVGLWFSGNEMEGIFVGLWVPAVHSLGALLLAGENWNDR
jgi:hypothetical protein